MSTAPTRTLIIGAGAREHALAWKLAGEPGMNEAVVAPGSAAIGAEPGVRCVPLDPLDGEAVVAAARAAAAELVVIGPEAPLSAGVSDALREAGVRVFGPSRAAADAGSSTCLMFRSCDAGTPPRTTAPAQTRQRLRTCGASGAGCHARGRATPIASCGRATARSVASGWCAGE